MKRSRKSFLSRVAVAAVVAAVFTPGLGAGPSFQGLGIPSGATSSVAHDVSDDGMVVVGRYEYPPATFPTKPAWTWAFRWTEAQGMTAIAVAPPPTAYLLTDAYAVSGDASVIVGEYMGSPGFGAFRWSEADGLVDLGFLAGGGPDSGARGLSADGSVVVGYSRPASGYREAFRWTEATAMVGLGHLPGADFLSSIAHALSTDGSVVVGASASAEGNQAFRWTEAAGMVGLGDLAGGDFWSEALAVSADGSVVVGWSKSASGREAFRWTKDAGIVGLGDLPGTGFSSTAYDVSGDGSIVVGASEGALFAQAFIWTQDEGMRILQDVLETDYGLNLEGWILRAATAISPDGNVIVGRGRNPNGQAEAWIAIIPEPATLALFALGGLGVLCRRSTARRVLQARDPVPFSKFA